MKARLAWIAGLVALLTALDQLYRVLHPVVDPARATLVGLSALAALEGVHRAGVPAFRCRIGALAIFAAALGSVLLIQGGWLVSRSPRSAALHVVFLAVAFVALDRRAPGPAADTA